jgi:hypothetical protein
MGLTLAGKRQAESKKATESINRSWSSTRPQDIYQQPSTASIHSHDADIASSALALSYKSSVYDALVRNGAILGIPCDSWNSNLPPSKSQLVLGAPEALQPTPLQLAAVHPRWVDRLPFPKMRDNLIVLINAIDEDEIINDILRDNSFALRVDSAPWEPAAWKVGKSFWEKWGYLFY